MIDKKRITDHHVIAKPLVPPLRGGERFYAKVSVAFGDENVDHQVLPFETWGLTQSEAEQKAEGKYQEWFRSSESDSN